MASGEVHQGDIGTTFKVTIKDGDTIVDISGATTKNIIFSKPDDTTLTVNGSFTTDGTDGVIQYNTVAGDLNITGLWKIQAYIVTGSGNWKSDVSYFDVYGNI